MRNKLIKYSLLLSCASFALSNTYAMDPPLRDIPTASTTAIQPQWTIEEKTDTFHFAVRYSKLILAKSPIADGFIQFISVGQRADKKFELSLHRYTKSKAYDNLEKIVEPELRAIESFYEQIRGLSYDVISFNKDVPVQFLSVFHKRGLIPDSVIVRSMKLIGNDASRKDAPSLQTNKQIAPASKANDSKGVSFVERKSIDETHASLTLSIDPMELDAPSFQQMAPAGQQGQPTNVADLADAFLMALEKAHPKLKIKHRKMNDILEGELYLWQENIKSLPEEIGSLTNLSVLSLSNNYLDSLPPNFRFLTNLKSLNLRGNKLVQLPEMKDFTNLTKLDLSGNKLVQLPEMKNFVNLSDLSVRGNNLTGFPHQILPLTNLTALDLGYGRITALPLELFEFTKLTQLNLIGNTAKIPAQIGKLTNLTFLMLRQCDLVELPEDFWSLQKLSELYLDENKLSILSDGLGNLTNLKTLSINHNNLKYVPSSIKALTNLTQLTMGHNSIAMRGNWGMRELVGHFGNRVYYDHKRLNDMIQSGYFDD